jgi:hypothetical protein
MHVHVNSLATRRIYTASMARDIIHVAHDAHLHKLALCRKWIDGEKSQCLRCLQRQRVSV